MPTYLADEKGLARERRVAQQGAVLLLVLGREPGALRCDVLGPGEHDRVGAQAAETLRHPAQSYDRAVKEVILQRNETPFQKKERYARE